MDRTSWKPKIYKATEAVDHKESLQDVHDSPPIVDSAKHIMKRQIQAYNDNPTPEGDSYGKPQGYPWQYGEESNFVYDYEQSWKNATLKQERLHLLLEADKTIDNNLISELIEKNWEDLPYEWQQKIKNAGVIPMYESKANEGLIDNIWGLLIDSSRMQFLDEYMGDMNTPLMITMGVMSMPQTNEELADALGVSKSEALKFISQWAYDNGITDTVYTEAKANEDDHKKSWGELDSIAKKGFSDIGYDQQSWDSEPEEVRAEMETVVKDNLGENWKEVANKFYKEELNKGKKSGGEGLISYQELIDHVRVDDEGDFVLCNYCNQKYDLDEMDKIYDNKTINKHLYGHGIRSPVVTAYDVLKDTESKANEDVGDSWYTRIVKCDQCDGQGSLDDYDRPAWSAGMRGTTKCSSCDGTGEKEETQNITDPYGDLHYMNESKASEHNVGDYVTMTDDALDNYGQQYRGQSFRISHVAKSVDDHMGYDEGMGGENLYDLDGFNSSLYDYEVESTDELKQMWNESKASEARKLNARQKKLIEEWVGSMSSPPMVITSDDLPYSLLSELRDINDFDGFESAIMRYASDLGNKQAMQGSNPYMHSSNYGSFESKANEVSASDDLKLKCPACGFKELIGSWLANWTIKPNQTSYESKASEEDPCWKGYKQIGMKDKNGKQVPNCVPESKSTEESWGKDFYNSLKDEYGYHNWNDNNQLSSAHDQIKLMKDYGIADKTLRQMGYDLKKDGIEGFIDRIEKELSKFGINLDKPEEQEE